MAGDWQEIERPAEKPVLVTRQGQIKSSFVLDETRDASRLRPSFSAGYGSGGDTSICRLARSAIEIAADRRIGGKKYV